MYKYCYNYIFIVQSSCDKLSDKLFESHRSSLDKLFDAYISSLDRQLSDKLSELYKSLSITSIAQDRGNHPFTRFPASPPFCSFSPNSQYLQKIQIYLVSNSKLFRRRKYKKLHKESTQYN